MPANESRFYTELEKIFTGADIEGEGGYINLLKIKSAYYKKILAEFQKQVDENDILKSSKEVKEEFFDRLYTFFERYFSECGSVYFVKTAAWQKVYEKVYTDNKDVVLFWKTNMLYYVKSDIMFKNMDISVEDERAIKHNFFFDCGTLKNKQNNEKKEIIFAYDKTEEVKHFFKVSYSEKNTKTKTDEILKAIKKTGNVISEKTLKKAFTSFEKQASVDFFINKDAKKFLTEQLDMYLHQILLDEKNEFDASRLTHLKIVKEFSLKIIDFVSQFEDELVRIWNKPKFVLNSNYVITMDKLTPEIIKKLETHSGWEEQTREWEELGMSKNEQNQDLFSDKTSKLPIDTKYFKDLEHEILSLFDDLDKVLDGRLIHSENYQALNTLQNRYKEKIDVCYIDPPYNAKSSKIPYLNDYKHSSWITLMENRISANKSFLNRNKFVEIIAIDEIEQERLGQLLTNIFPDNIKSCLSIVHNPRGQQGNNISYKHEFAYFIYPNDKEKFLGNVKKKEIDSRNLRDSGTESDRTDARKCFFPIIVDNNNNVIGFGEVSADDFHPQANVKLSNGNTEIYPIDDNGKEKKWRYEVDTIPTIKSKLTAKMTEKYLQIIFHQDEETLPSLLVDSKYDASEYGTKVLQSILGIEKAKSFSYSKSINTVKDNIEIGLNGNKNGLVLDYFGGSGTTAHAVINLNKDGGHRKYILVEVNKYFDTVILPRIKKVCYSDKWEDGKAQDGGKGISQFFKYYTLEQYAQTLNKMKYSEIASTLFNETNRFANYVFLTDEKLSFILDINRKNNVVDLDFDKLYENIDFPETISLIKGKAIKKITENSVILEGNETIRYDYKNFTDEEKVEFVKLLKPLLWWGKE